MGKARAYFKGCLEINGFKTPFVVYASSAEHATLKAIKCGGARLEYATVQNLEGPYYSHQA